MGKEIEPRAFVDKDHPVMMEYYELLEEEEEEMEIEELEVRLKKMIKKDPLFFDSYSMLSEIYEDLGRHDEAEEIRNIAFEKAVKQISKKGVWPDILEWGWLENRHIIRAILRQAIYYWSDGELNTALDLFRKLFTCNLRDNIGARFYILAIRLGMDYENYLDKFESGDYLDQEIYDWFDKNSIKFPEDFKEFHELEE